MLQKASPQAYTEFQPLEEIMVGKGYSIDLLDEFTESMTTTTKRLGYK